MFKDLKEILLKIKEKYNDNYIIENFHKEILIFKTWKYYS